MSLEVLFLGTGTSAGIPMIGCDCPVCRSSDPRDQRSRPSILVSWPDPVATPDPKPDIKTLKSPAVGAHDPSHALSPLDTAHITPSDHRRRSIIIDTAPELRLQVIRHRVSRIDGVFYTHAHADHIFGLDDLRRFNAVMHAPIDIYADARTLEVLKAAFWYIFEPHRNVNQSFVASLVPHTLETGQPLNLYGATWTPIPLMHGHLPILGFRIDLPDAPAMAGKPGSRGGALAYCTDVSAIPDASAELLAGLDVLIIDALRYEPHPTHLTVKQALGEANRLKPRMTWFTHIAHDISHAALEAELPPTVRPSYDGLALTVARPAPPPPPPPPPPSRPGGSAP